MRRLSAFSPPDGLILPTQSSAEGNEIVVNNEMTFSGQPQPANKELLNIAVEIGDGKSASILIREGDDPYQVSFGFAKRYGLND